MIITVDSTFIIEEFTAILLFDYPHLFETTETGTESSGGTIRNKMSVSVVSVL